MARVFLRHVLDLGHCRPGIRAYCERHGLALQDLIGPAAPGIDLEAFRAIGDRHALELVAHMEALEGREAERGQQEHP